MKEKIYTIPVNDAYADTGFCPLCRLESTMNDNLLAYYLGPALMEPDVRKTTNSKGFCRDHLAALYSRKENRLGLGLMLHTHTVDLLNDLGPALAECAPSGKAGLLRGRQKDFRQTILAMADRVRQRIDSCIICDRLNATMARYLDVIFYQYFIDPAFKQRFDAGTGYCLPHLERLLRGAAEHLNQNQAAEFITCLAALQNNCLETLREDVEWFTLKFDYRNHDKDWKNSKDALPRAIHCLRGDKKGCCD